VVVRIVSSPVYLDTSALAKVYFAERGSSDLESALIGRTDLIVSDLAVTELTSALKRRSREGQFEHWHCQDIYEQVMRDLRDGQYHWAQLTPAVHREAEKLLLEGNVSLRAADALHLAIAAVLDVGTLITFDKQMARAAREIGTLELAC
jgi:predicted nucleic acid-binding protein